MEATYFAVSTNSSSVGSSLDTIIPRFIFAGSRAQFDSPMKPTVCDLFSSSFISLGSSRGWSVCITIVNTVFDFGLAREHRRYKALAFQSNYAFTRQKSWHFINLYAIIKGVVFERSSTIFSLYHRNILAILSYYELGCSCGPTEFHFTFSGILGESSANPTSSSTTTDTKLSVFFSFWNFLQRSKVCIMSADVVNGLHWHASMWTY